MVELARRGDDAAWRELFDGCYPRIHRFLAARLARPAADDLAANVFLEAFRSIDRFEWRGRPFEAWLFGIARHQLASHYRAEERAVAPDAEPAVLDSYLPLEVRETLQRLSPDHRQALELRYLVGLTGEEAAAAMGRSHNAFRQLLHRATAAFRREDAPDEAAPLPTRRSDRGPEAIP